MADFYEYFSLQDSSVLEKPKPPDPSYKKKSYSNEDIDELIANFKAGKK